MSALDKSSRFRSWAVTHPGTRRTHNEDALVDRGDIGLWAVADGAGGHAAGDVASRTIAEALAAIPANLPAATLPADVRSTIARANADLRQEAARRGPGVLVVSTVVILLARDEQYACLWAGDSRAYLLRAGALRQITRDHSLVQELLDSGAIQPVEAAGHPRGNVITRAVGAADAVVLDAVSDQLVPGDRLLLCSDGLCKTLPERELARLLGSVEASPAQVLVDAALALNARDNVTAVVAEFIG